MPLFKGEKGKVFARVVGNVVENRLEERLNSRAATVVETPKEQLGEITGRRKALYIGINYFGQKGELRGCINDVHNIKAFFEERSTIDESMVLTDDNPEHMPTRENILNAFQWLREDCQPGDSLILHYSGHGGTQADEAGDEVDGMDSTLCPVDYAENGIIVDDEVHNVLVRGLPKGVRLTAILDCCHSEGMLDLPFCYNVSGDLEITENDRAKGISSMVAAGVRFALDGNKKDAVQGFVSGAKQVIAAKRMQRMGIDGSAARQKRVENNTTEADVISFSGCKDAQTSADAHIDGQATGAMTYALINAFSEGPLEYTELLRTMRRALEEGGYTQVPMMCAGRKLDLTEKCSI